MLTLEQLESREVPATFVSWEGYVPFPHLEQNQVVEVGGDFDGNGIADAAFIPNEGSGGSVHVKVLSGGTPGIPPVIGPGGIGYDPTRGLELYNAIFFDQSFRGGAVASAIRSPDGSHAILAVSPGAGGGPIVNLLDLKDNTLKTQLVLDINYRGGLRFVNLPPLDGVGHPDSLVMATPAPGGGGGPVATIFDGSGAIVRKFFVGPADDRSGSYQPIPYGAGTLAPDNSGKYGSWFAADGVGPFFMDVDGIRRERVGPFTNSDGTVV